MSNEPVPINARNGLIDSQSTTPSPTSKKRLNGAAPRDANGNPMFLKSRAAKVCTACRARKVRCDVIQRYHIAADGEVSCSNCIMDAIKCVIGVKKRRRRNVDAQPATTLVPETLQAAHTQTLQNGLANPADIVNSENRTWSGLISMSTDAADTCTGFSAPQNIAHSIYQNVEQQTSNGKTPQRQNVLGPPFEIDPTYALLKSASIYGDRTATRLVLAPTPFIKHVLPDYIKPLPQHIASVDIDHLFSKGALSIPSIPARNALFRSYVEFVHPYMPVIEIHELMEIVEEGTGASGQLSLLLFQTIMFAGTAFVDMKYLRSAGYSNRTLARKAFFQKARVLYDFDYELDPISLLQSVLLMTYWDKAPDDEKNTWHWMGVAISLAYRIGLHRNPDRLDVEPRKRKLWKRIWWSCLMRDHLIALGLGRPTRVKDGDHSVPMLIETDFEISQLPEHITTIPRECTLARDEEAQRDLAQMCIAKAKLCLCVGHVLTLQYSFLARGQSKQAEEGPTRSSVMLSPKKLDQTDGVRNCVLELSRWITELPTSCQYFNKLGTGNIANSIFVNKAILHMAYYTTLSALHRPQVRPFPATIKPDGNWELHDMSRRKVREASREMANISQDLHACDVAKYLPVTGVTFLLPAIIIHVLDIKSCNEDTRQAAINSFCQCILVLDKLRDAYASADFAMQFLEAAIRKAKIEVVIRRSTENLRRDKPQMTLAIDKLNEMYRRSEDMLSPKRGLGLISGNSASEDIDINDFLTFDNGDEV